MYTGGMPRPPLPFRLKAQDAKAVDRLLQSGVQQVRVVLRAMALRQLAQGASAPEVAKLVPLTPQVIRRIVHRYRRGGLDRALYERPRPGAAEVLSPADKQRIVALACSPPPVGMTRWTVRLIAEEAVHRGVVPRVGRETIRVLLQSHDLKPWREKNVVRG
jgi:putative transposase